MVRTAPHSNSRLRGVAALLPTLALLAPAAVAAPQDAEGDFFRAYYLEHELGDLDGALKLYLAAAEDKSRTLEERTRALQHAEACAEELAAGDLARLVPEDTILYVELNEPGGQLAKLLDQLGLLQGGEDAGSIGISPHLLEGTLGLRGAAVAVTRIDPTGGMPGGVAILHPGDMQAVRGLIETALPAGGEPAQPIGGHPTFVIEGMVHVTTTDRLVLASTERELIAGVLERVANGGQDSLAGHPDLASTMALRGDDLGFFCLNAEPVIPLAQTLLGVLDRQDPQAAMAMRMLDVESFEAVAGRLGVDDDGLSLDVSLQLAEGHRNLAFNLLRMPHVGAHTFDLIPSGAAAFMATSLNSELEGSAGVTDAQGRPVVTIMDLGREVFGNMRDVAVFTLPSMAEGPGGEPIPDAALAMTVNDVERSRAIWELVLGVAKGATGGGSTQPRHQEVAGTRVHRYDLQGMGVYLYAHGDHVVLSPSLRAIEGAVRAAKGENVANDAAFADLVRTASSDHTSVVGVSIGRCAAMARPMIPQHELGPVLDLLADSSFTATTRHSDTQLAWSAKFRGIPNVGPMVEKFVQTELRGGRADRRFVMARPGPSPIQDMIGARTLQVASAETLSIDEAFEVSREIEDSLTQGSLEATKSAFDMLARSGDHVGGAKLIPTIGELIGEDANALNDFVWEVISSPEGEHYAKALLPLTARSNQLTDHGSWYYLDTMAHVMFAAGKVDGAIKLQQKAVAIAQETGDGRADEARASLAKFRAEG